MAGQYLKGVKGTKGFKAVAIALLIPLLSSCFTDNQLTGRSQFISIPESQDAAMGLQAFNEVKEQVKVISSGPMAERVSRIGRRIAAVSDKPNLDWEFAVIDEDVMNAWALPGGKLAFYRPMVENFTDGELAAVMGHEIAHAILRHGAEQVSRAQMQQLLVSAAVVGTAVATEDEGKAQTVAVLSGLAVNGFVALPHSRAMELEADWIGTRYMARAGYDPRNAVSLWQKMAQMKDGKGAPPPFMSTHPTDGKRISLINDRMDEFMADYRRATSR